MDIEYIVSITDPNAPVFHKGWKKGIISKTIITFHNTTKKDLKSPMFLKQIYDTRDELLNQHAKCTFKIVSKNYKIK